MTELRYTPLEALSVPRPVCRLEYLVERCRGKAVLDLGCYDETALVKRGTGHWAHGEIAAVARSVLGVDSSEQIPPGGITTGPTSRIVRGEVADLGTLASGAEGQVEVIVAGELIEHLPHAVAFLSDLRRRFPGRRLLATTPNATSLTNVLLGLASRESNHPDHLQIYSFKTLHTLCRRVGLTGWTIVPYHVRYTELALRSGPLARLLVKATEHTVNLCEWLFPLLSGGLILDVERL